MNKKLNFLVVATILFLTMPALAEVTEKILPVSDARVFVKVGTIAGDVRITGVADAREVQVRADTQGNNVQPKIEQKDGQIFIQESRSQKGFFSGAGGKVNFEIRLPATATIEVRTVSGEITARNMAGNVDLKTVSGNLTLTLNDSADTDLKSVSGDIDVGVAATYRSVLSATTVSGEINLALSRNADARFQASSLSGDITCRPKLEDMRRKKGFGSLTLTGLLGNGSGKITLGTISGNIRVR